MELGKKTVSGEDLEFLKSISPKIAKLAGTATSLELKADQLFSDTKKGKSAKQKFYIFIAILLFDRQPIIMKKKFTWEVRSNISTKSEVEAILTEAGVKDTKAIFERAKRYYETSEKEKTAAKPASVKGKSEHASESRRLPRGLRARMSRTRERDEENYGFEYNEEAARWEEFNRPPTEEERKRWEEIAKRLRAEQAERNRWHREFKRKEAAAWQRQFPGKPYTPHETYNYIYNETTDTWEKIDFSEPPPNPFYNDERWRRPNAAPPAPNNEVPPEPPRNKRNEDYCKEVLRQKGILVAGDTPKETKKKFLMWAIVNHPDKGGDTETFQEVSDCYDKAIKPLLPHGGGNLTRRRKHSH